MPPAVQVGRGTKAQSSVSIPNGIAEMNHRLRNVGVQSNVLTGTVALTATRYGARLRLFTAAALASAIIIGYGKADLDHPR